MIALFLPLSTLRARLAEARTAEALAAGRGDTWREVQAYLRAERYARALRVRLAWAGVEA